MYLSKAFQLAHFRFLSFLFVFNRLLYLTYHNITHFVNSAFGEKKMPAK